VLRLQKPSHYSMPHSNAMTLPVVRTNLFHLNQTIFVAFALVSMLWQTSKLDVSNLYMTSTYQTSGFLPHNGVATFDQLIQSASGK
jgi:ABC-type phosphate/phosphonate transport system permease subunit